MRLTIVAAPLHEAVIRPQGIHLRWAFPSAAGFPEGGFRVFRRPATRKPGTTVVFTPPSPGTTSGSEHAFGVGSERVTVRLPAGAGMTVSATGTLAVNAPAGVSGEVEIGFAAPVSVVRVEVRSAGALVTMRGVAGGVVVAEADTSGQQPTAGVTVREIVAPFLDGVVLPLTVGEVMRVAFSTEASVVTESWGAPLVTLPMLGPASTPADALARLPVALRNRFAASRGAAVARYEPGLPALLEMLGRCRKPLAEQPDLDADADGAPLRSLAPQAALLLAALDPNIARFLGLYWVDETAAPGSHDYRVEGDWPDGSVSGMQFAVGANAVPAPQVLQVRGKQSPGSRFRGSEPRGRVALGWRRPGCSAARRPRCSTTCNGGPSLRPERRPRCG